MAEAAGAVTELLHRAVRAGVAPGAEARWGRVAARHHRVTAGASAVMPAHREVADDTWFDLASLTKPLVATTLTLLGFRTAAFGLRTRVGELLDELRGTAVGDLEVEALLTHTSGLPAWLPLYCLTEGRPEALIDRLGRVALQAPPGERVVYSCLGFVILGRMLERLSDQTLDRLFDDRVVSVLGLREQVGFCPDPETRSLSGGATEAAVERRLVEALGLDPRWIPPVGRGLPDDGNARFLGGAAGNAGLFGTAVGVAALAGEFLPGGGALLTCDEAATATALRTSGLEQARGLGWQLASTPGCAAGQGFSDAAFGHTGFTGVSVWCEPKDNTVFVLLTNRNHPNQRENDLHPLRRRYHRLAAGALDPAVGPPSAPVGAPMSACRQIASGSDGGETVDGEENRQDNRSPRTDHRR